MDPLNLSCFSQPHWRVIAQGFETETWFEDGQAVGSGGIMMPKPEDLRIGQITSPPQRTRQAAKWRTPSHSSGEPADGPNRNSALPEFEKRATAVSFQPRFRALYRRVLCGLTAALEPHGADRGGVTNAMRLKNPLSAAWSSMVFAEALYSLNDLRSVAVNPWGEPTAAKAPVADHPDPEIAVSSNSYFRALGRQQSLSVNRHAKRTPYWSAPLRVDSLSS
jgi:hypothetical protein